MKTSPREKRMLLRGCFFFVLAFVAVAVVLFLWNWRAGVLWCGVGSAVLGVLCLVASDDL